MKISTVLFDFDGIIVDTEWVIYEEWLNIFLKEGENLSLETYVQCIGSDHTQWSPSLYLESLTGKKYDWEDLHEKRNIQIRKRLQGQKEMPGVRLTLEALQSSSVRCAVVSSSSHHWVDRWLEKLELTSFFQEVVCRGDAASIKPAPDLFLEAARRLGVTPESCWVIEDSMNGFIAARAAGMKTCIIPNRVTSCLDFKAADLQLPSMESLLPQPLECLT